MNLFRLLILGFLVWFVWRALRSWRVEIKPRDPAPPHSTSGPERYEAMTQCSRCGVHLPQRALAASGRCGACEHDG